MPTDEQRALWASIRANPLDDAPRLVYADWLQEHGDEARAEFIRVQVELARLGPDRRKGRKRRLPLEAREKALLAAHREDWSAPIIAAVVGAYPRTPRDQFAAWIGSRGFRRGFAVVDLFHFDGARFLTWAEAVEPLESIRIRIEREEQPPRCIDALAQWEGSNSVADLVIAGAADEDVAAIVQKGQLRHLSQLHLIHGSVTDAGVRELLSWQFITSLRELDLTNNPITNAGARAIAESPRLAHLVLLKLSRIPLSSDVRSDLQRAFSHLILDPEF